MPRSLDEIREPKAPVGEGQAEFAPIAEIVELHAAIRKRTGHVSIARLLATALEFCFFNLASAGYGLKLNCAGAFSRSAWFF